MFSSFSRPTVYNNLEEKEMKGAAFRLYSDRSIHQFLLTSLSLEPYITFTLASFQRDFTSVFLSNARLVYWIISASSIAS
ncbi:hypothetical protein VN97_g1951 [Penicillium thymicola]|uniref:Uncharacterized protein n=1 Tax=Penicillium thymicola TaxID=293382 RepID=A0AAI9TQM6_PENTH|nr:hypothetical protein VN97_g1951 [Penicillium thymicola]